MMTTMMMIIIMTILGGLCGHELYPRVSHRAPRQHGSPRLLPRHKPGGYCGSKYFYTYAPQCAVDTDSLPPSHEEVLDAAATKEGDLRRFVAELIKMLSSHLL